MYPRVSVGTINRPAPQLMQKGQLREDLYDHLSAYTLTIPPGEGADEGLFPERHGAHRPLVKPSSQYETTLLVGPFSHGLHHLARVLRCDTGKCDAGPYAE